LVGPGGPAGAALAPGSKAARPAGSTRARQAAKSRAAASPVTHPDAAPRKLQDIHIEGEIPVPQVLFITARDQRRFVDFQHRRYLRTSLEVGEQTVFPSRIALVRNHPADARKETP
jgi:hypothetical protein